MRASSILVSRFGGIRCGKFDGLAKNANTSSTGYGTHCCVSNRCVMASMVSRSVHAWPRTNCDAALINCVQAFPQIELHRFVLGCQMVTSELPTNRTECEFACEKTSVAKR